MDCKYKEHGAYPPLPPEEALTRPWRVLPARPFGGTRVIEQLIRGGVLIAPKQK